MENGYFLYDERLGIELPHLTREWEHYSEPVREEIIEMWEQVRGSIPERIKEMEKQINEKQALMDDEPDFAACCRINSEIAELASRINDLHIWFRVNQDVGVATSHS